MSVSLVHSLTTVLRIHPSEERYPCLIEFHWTSPILVGKICVKLSLSAQIYHTQILVVRSCCFHRRNISGLF
jgi:hypothetical protein